MKQKKSVKQNNRQVILNYIRSLESFSVADISERVGISKPTVKKVIDFYGEYGLVIGAGKGSSTDEGGKRPSLFQFNRSYGFVIAIHIGPDFIYSAVMDLGAEIVHSSFTTIPELCTQDVIAELKTIIETFLSQEWSRGKELVNITVALPGIVDSVNGLSIYSPHYPCWGEDWAFRDDFIEALKPITEAPVYVDNINRLQAFAEKEKGQARGVNNFLTIDAMDEGVGAGVIVNGTIRHGGQNLSGEIGHMVLDSQGPECICGGRGCFEALVSARHINSLLGAAMDRDDQGDDPMGLTELFSAVEEGNESAIAVMDRITGWFAQGLNNVIMVNDPRMIIIQGIYIEAGESFLSSLKAKIDGMSFPNLSRNVDLVYSRFGRERGVLGAGCFGVWRYFNSNQVYAALEEDLAS